MRFSSTPTHFIMLKKSKKEAYEREKLNENEHFWEKLWK